MNQRFISRKDYVPPLIKKKVHDVKWEYLMKYEFTNKKYYIQVKQKTWFNPPLLKTRPNCDWMTISLPANPCPVQNSLQALRGRIVTCHSCWCHVYLCGVWFEHTIELLFCSGVSSKVDRPGRRQRARHISTRCSNFFDHRDTRFQRHSPQAVLCSTPHQLLVNCTTFEKLNNMVVVWSLSSLKKFLRRKAASIHSNFSKWAWWDTNTSRCKST